MLHAYAKEHTLFTVCSVSILRHAVDVPVLGMPARNEALLDLLLTN